MNNFGNKIKSLRKRNKLSQKELADALGYKTYTTISKWERESSLPPSNELRKLALYFGVSADYLLGIEEDDLKNNEGDSTKTVALDYVGDEHIDYFLQQGVALDPPFEIPKIEVPAYILNEEPDNYFVVKMVTDSLNRLINNGDDIVVLNYTKCSDAQHKSGDILLVKLDEEYTVKQLRVTHNYVHLESDSYIEGFKDLVFSKEDFETLEVVGKVISAFRLFQ